MHNAVLSYFATVCTVQVSVQVFATKKTKMDCYSLYVTSVCNRWDVLILMLALSPRRNILCDKKM